MKKKKDLTTVEGVLAAFKICMENGPWRAASEFEVETATYLARAVRIAEAWEHWQSGTEGYEYLDGHLQDAEKEPTK